MTVVFGACPCCGHIENRVAPGQPTPVAPGSQPSVTATAARLTAAGVTIAPQPAPDPHTSCPFCGAPGRYVTADEGTSYFAPQPAPDLLAAARAVVDAWDADAMPEDDGFDPMVYAVGLLRAAIEKAERG